MNNANRLSDSKKGRLFSIEKGEDCSGSFVVYRMGTGQKVLQYLKVAEKPVSYREIGSALKSSDFEQAIIELVNEDLIVEIDDKKGKHFIITFKGISKSTPNYFTREAEAYP